MERARSDMIRAVGVDQGAALRADGSAYYVAEVDIKYRKPARLGDDLLVVSTVEAVRAASVDIHQRVMRGPRSIDRREGDRRLPGPRRPAAAPAEGLGRAVQDNHVREVMRFSISNLALFAAAMAVGRHRASPVAAGHRGSAAADPEERQDRGWGDRRDRHPDRAADRLRPSHGAAPSIRWARTA